jgi:hypothetical protein
MHLRSDQIDSANARNAHNDWTNNVRTPGRTAGEAIRESLPTAGLFSQCCAPRPWDRTEFVAPKSSISEADIGGNSSGRTVHYELCRILESRGCHLRQTSQYTFHFRFVCIENTSGKNVWWQHPKCMRMVWVSQTQQDRLI